MTLPYFVGASFEGYGWTIVPESLPLNYICEILQSETSQIDFEQRDEGK